MIRLMIASMRSRLVPIVLVIVALSASMALLLAVDRIQQATKNGFNQSLSGVDLVLGPGGSGLELVLYTVFHLGKPTNNITTETVSDITDDPMVEWAVPIALGDNHRGYRVISTTDEYFDRIKFGGDQPLVFAQGAPFSDLNETVIGSEVAEALGYALDTSIFVTHGSQMIGKLHDDFSFKITGILESTGTPIDRAVFVSLEGYELVHLGWQNGSKTVSLQNLDINAIPKERLYPKTVTAVYLGLTSKLSLFKFIRAVRDYPEEAISAVIPGVALAELWSIVGIVDSVFQLLNWLIIGISIVGMVTMIITGLDSRTRELTILRALGLSPPKLAGLVLLETIIISLTAVLSAIVLVWFLTVAAADLLNQWAGVRIELTWLAIDELSTIMIIVLAGVCASLIPAGMVYRRSLHKGFSN
ncbi:MAG: ABC transporter permease [Litorivicinaceae bacterium]|nr:MAG: ABC transporter permease [Litorivicinaceae bacterium]|tara:strand:+ start:1018 stop:2265 length:1248 start_codon:yes stop_codon:yes gene_type:complete